jgi:phosphoglycerate kinase
MLTMDKVDFKGKTVFLRVDINSPYENGRLGDSERIQAHAKTIRELSEKGAKVVVLGHQGRPGDPDFLRLDRHAELLSKHAGKRIEFVADVMGPCALEMIDKLKRGEIILLDNVRLLAEETLKLEPKDHAKTVFVQTLALHGDVFVNDAFSVSHRSHASVVGFTQHMKSVAGRVMESEYTNCSKFVGSVSKPFVMIMAGTKPEEVIDVISNLAPKADRILVGGVIGELFLMASGRKLGRKETWLKEKGLLEFIDPIKKIYSKHRRKIVMPVDVAADASGKRVEIPVSRLPSNHVIMDIGPKTIELFCQEIMKAKSLLMKGPVGTYEKKGFDLGTKEVLKAVESSQCFSLLGGGHTSSLIDRFGIDPKKISYVSLSGGALIEFLSGKKLPGVEALK